MRDVGFYDHGMYPVVFDVLYPEEGTPYGFGIIDIGRDPQMYIDRLDAAVLDTIFDSANVRYFAKRGAGINIDDFLDRSKKVVEVEGDISEERLQRIEPPSLPAGILDIKSKLVGLSAEVQRGGAQGQASDIEITAREIQKLKKELYTIISNHSGMPFDKVEKDSDRDYWMTSAEAKEYGMIDDILIKGK